MAQSLSKILVHCVFSTKGRTRSITTDTRDALHAYLQGALENLGCPSLQIGGIEDHVHILHVLGRTMSVSEVVERIKKSSSKWMKNQGVPFFAWQSGYGAFSIGESQADRLVQYIRNQEEHHRFVSFQDELRAILRNYRITFDERYLWD